jgi:thiamine-monophosphate kinase
MSSNENKGTPISELGKFGLINLISKKASGKNSTTVTGIGDDAAVLGSGKSLTLISTDLLLEGIHFNLIYTPLKHLGYKSVIRAISDIYAMNGTPQQVFISLGISSRFSVEMIEEIYEGIHFACENYKVDLAGGDTSSSLTGLTIAVTAAGFAESDSIIRRSGAKPNDLICVTGNFGASFMGLQLLERERRLFEKERITQPDLEGFDYTIGRQLKPEFPVKTLTDILESGIKPTSMIDVTDGLASDLLQLCKSSDTGCKIFYSKIPVDYETSRLAEEFNVDAMIPALNGGDDYELLFTVPLEAFEKIKRIDSVSIIGHMTTSDSGCFIAGDDGSEVRLTAQGWGLQ